MAQRFDSLGGGLVDTVVAGVGNNASTAIQNIGSGQQASFGINSVLGGAVQDASGYALNQGQNYLTSQLGASLGNNINNSLANAVVTQIATAGINQAINFVSQAIPNPFFGGSNVTTAGLGAQGAKSSISIPDSVVSKLEDADYGGSAYTVQDIVFTLTPATAGAQGAPQAQSTPIVPLDTAFNSNTNLNSKALDTLKTQQAFALPASGAAFNPNADFVKPAAISTKNIKPLW
jgi:hypothetical protein